MAQCTCKPLTPRALESGIRICTREHAVNHESNLHFNSSCNRNPDRYSSNTTKFGLSPATRNKICRYYMWFIVFLLIGYGIVAVVLVQDYNWQPLQEPLTQYKMEEGMPPELLKKNETGPDTPFLKRLEPRQLVVPAVQDIPVDENNMPAGPIPWTVEDLGQLREEATKKMVAHVQNGVLSLLGGHGCRGDCTTDA